MSTPRPPAALTEARKRQATARARVESIDAEVTKLRDALDAAARARESAKSTLRAGGQLPPALAQAVGESLALTEVLADEEVALAAALRALTDAEVECQALERQHALAVAAVAERDLVPRVVAAVAALHELARDLDAATGDAINAAREPHQRVYGWVKGDKTRPQALAATVRAVWEESARVTAAKLRDMELDADAARVKEGRA